MKVLNKKRIEKYQSSISKAYDYYVGCQRKDGSFLKPKDENSGAHYTAYYVMALQGKHSAAKKYHNYTTKKIIDINDGLQYVDRNSTWATHTSYFKGWFAYGAHMAGFYDQSLNVIGNLNRFIDYQNGGVYQSDYAATNRTFTCFNKGGPIAMAMLATGQWREAYKIGEYMLDILKKQPKPKEKFYGFAYGKTAEIVTKAKIFRLPMYGFEDWGKENSESLRYEEHEIDQYNFCIDTLKPYQPWACFGPPFAFMIGMYEATNDIRYIDGMMQIFELFYKSRNQYSTQYISSCKILQGLPQLYLNTNDERILETIIELSDYLVEKQKDYGYWVKETIVGLSREVSEEEQDEWLKICQTGDILVSLINVVKYLS